MWDMLISDTHGLPAPRSRPEPALVPLGAAVGAPAATATGGTGGAAACSAHAAVQHRSMTSSLLIYVGQSQDMKPMHSVVSPPQ